jgi:hypothetical protein
LVIVAVYSVLVSRAADVVKVATVFPEFIATVPDTVVPATFSLSVNVLSAPGATEVIVSGSIASLKAAVIFLPPPGTSAVLIVTSWLPLVGDDEVTVGPVIEHTAPGMIGAAGRGVDPPPGAALSSPPPPPHPGIKKTHRNKIKER